MENPNEWIEDFSSYVTDDTIDFFYGDFVKLKENAPQKAVESYCKYIKLCSHVLPSWNDIIIEDWEIKGFRKTDDPALQRQYDIVMELIEKEYIDRFIKH